jgi:hypothetical protein
MYFLKTWKMAFAAVHFLWKYMNETQYPGYFHWFLSFYKPLSKLNIGQRNMCLKENWIWNLNNVITKMFPKNKCTHCGSISSPKDNFHSNFLPFLPLNQFCVLYDFLFIITDYKSMYLLLPAATVNFDVQYMQKSVFTEHERLFLV